MSQPKNSTTTAPAQLPAPLVTAAATFHAPFTAAGKKIFAVRAGVSSDGALEQVSCLLELAIDLLESVVPGIGGAGDYELANRAARCSLEPAKSLLDAVRINMDGPQFTTDAPADVAESIIHASPRSASEASL